MQGFEGVFWKEWHFLSSALWADILFVSGSFYSHHSGTGSRARLQKLLVQDFARSTDTGDTITDLGADLRWTTVVQWSSSIPQSICVDAQTWRRPISDSPKLAWEKMISCSNEDSSPMWILEEHIPKENRFRMEVRRKHDLKNGRTHTDCK